MTGYLIRLPFVLIAHVIGFIAAYFLPLLAKPRMGRINNSSAWATEPRLPGWLSWFQTPDNSLLGDENWKASHDGGYWSQVGWLRRNRVYGFLWWSPIAHVPAAGVTYSTTGDTTIHARDNAKAGSYEIRGSDGSFERTTIWQVFRLPVCFNLRIGWILGDALPGQRCLYLFTVRPMPFREATASAAPAIRPER